MLQVSHFKAMFKFFDVNHDGEISRRELGLMMQAVGSSKKVHSGGNLGLPQLMRIMAKHECSPRWVE